MSGTLFFTDALGTSAGLALSLVIGILFGFFLDKAGFGSSRRLTGIFYFRDMSVLKVMFTAVVTCMVGFQYLQAAGWVRAEELYALDTFWGAQIVGGLVFGAGFVIGGWCPGTAFVGLANLKLDALVFLLGATLGSILFNEVFGLVLPLYSATAGTLDLSGSLGLARPVLVTAFSVAAVFAFAGSTALETRVGGAPAPTGPDKVRNRLAATVLVVLALGTFLLPVPARPTSAAAQETQPVPGAIGLLDEVEAAVDHVEPMELAARLMAGEPGLVVVDVRPAPDYAKFHIRGAVSIPLPELAARAQAELPGTGTVVLYSNGTTHPAQAWLLLRQAGWTNVLVLTDGLLAFWRQCLTPPSLRDGEDPATAAAASSAFAARRAYFMEGK